MDATVKRMPASELQDGDSYIAKGGKLREIERVWRSRGSYLFAGSRARVETVQAKVIGIPTPVGFDLTETLTVIRTD
jgi:hypothetical protein